MISITRKHGATRARRAILCAALALGGCAGQPPAPASDNPQVLLLGEVHDNPGGHRQRFDDLRRRVEAGWRPVIAMEQFDHEQQAELSAAERTCADADCVLRAVAGPGWDWDQYRPVIALALRYGLPLVAANLSRADAARTMHDGLAASFDAETVLAYGLRTPLPADIVALQQQHIVAGHCNLLPPAMVGGMVEAQVARDIWMAKIVRAQQPRAVVLLAGNGHVRKDIGVARWLNVPAPALAVRSEAYLEADMEADAAQAYDIAHVIAGPQQTRSDPCEQLRPAS